MSEVPMTTTPLSHAELRERTYAGNFTLASLEEAVEIPAVTFTSRTVRDLIAHLRELLSAPAAPRERETDLTTPYEPVIIEFKEAGFAQFIIADVPTIVWEIGDRYGATPLLDFDRNVVGFRWPLAPSTSGGK